MEAKIYSNPSLNTLQILMDDAVALSMTQKQFEQTVIGFLPAGSPFAKDNLEGVTPPILMINSSSSSRIYQPRPY